MASPEQIKGPQDFARVFSVSRETVARLETYAALLVQWQKTMNLVAPSTLGEIWHRHFADSAQLLRLAPPGATTWLDLGSGAGFPGLVLAILRSEAIPDLIPGRATGRACHILIESDTRKAAFLREVARQTGVAVDIVVARIESPATHAKVGPVDIVTARALAPLEQLLELAEQFFTSETKGLFLKGQDVEGEIEDARKRWSFDYRLEASLTNPLARIVVIENMHVKPEG